MARTYRPLCNYLLYTVNKTYKYIDIYIYIKLNDNKINLDLLV